MEYFGRFALDKEKDILVELSREGEELHYVLRTPNHGTGNLIRNLARLCKLPLSEDEQGLLTCGVLACLKGLREQGCNGPVTEAIGKIEKHLNRKAHE